MESCVVNVELGTEKICIFAVHCPRSDIIDNFFVKIRGHVAAGCIFKLLNSCSW